MNAALSPTVRLRNRAMRRLLRLPPTALRRIVGPAVEVDGQRLDLQIQALLAARRAAGIEDSDDVATSRRAMDEDTQAVAPALRHMARLEPWALVIDDVRLRARLYVPATAPPTPALLVYFHGGGFVVGGLASHDAALRELAHDSGVAILAVAYRLAPEHKAPTAVDDAHGAYLWARRHAEDLRVDADWVGVGGDSAGGNLSALVSARCRERRDRVPDTQLLIYPATDLACTFPSHRTFERRFLLDKERIDWFLRNYLRDDEQRTSSEISPLCASRFDGLPHTILATAGFDSLRDEGAAYASKLREAGVPVTYRCEKSLIHGFFHMAGAVSAASAANQAIASDLRGATARRR